MYQLQDGGDRGNRIGQYYYLNRQNEYVNGVEELNKICAIYGTGEGATSARIVNVDDVDWITGYNPNNIEGSGTKFATGQIHEYGNNVKYTLLSTGVRYEPTNSVASGTDTRYTQFTYCDEASKIWRSLATDESVILKSSEYYYYPTTLTETDDTTATVGIGVNTPEYKMLFTNSSTGADTENSGKTDNVYYWLGSLYVHTDTGFVSFGLRYIYEGCVLPQFVLLERRL